MTKIDVIQQIEEEIDMLSTYLSREVSDMQGVSFRQERQVGKDKREYLFELVVMKYVNEDDYGPSLTVSLELEPLYRLDMSVIRGYGALIDQRVATFTVQSSNYPDIHHLFREMGEVLVTALKELY